VTGRRTDRITTPKTALAQLRRAVKIHHCQEREHASLLAISQLRHQSATAPILATHAADAVELINVMKVTVRS